MHINYCFFDLFTIRSRLLLSPYWTGTLELVLRERDSPLGHMGKSPCGSVTSILRQGSTTLGGVDNVIICPIERSQLCIFVWWVRHLHLFNRNADVVPGCTPVDYCGGRGLLVFYRAAWSRCHARGLLSLLHSP